MLNLHLKEGKIPSGSDFTDGPYNRTATMAKTGVQPVKIPGISAIKAMASHVAPVRFTQFDLPEGTFWKAQAS